MSQQLKAGDRVQIIPPHEDWQNEYENIRFVRLVYDGEAVNILVRNLTKNKSAVFMKGRVKKHSK